MSMLNDHKGFWHGADNRTGDPPDSATERRNGRKMVVLSDAANIRDGAGNAGRLYIGNHLAALRS